MVLPHVAVRILRMISQQTRRRIQQLLREEVQPAKDLDAVPKVGVIAKPLRDVAKHAGIVDMLIKNIINLYIGKQWTIALRGLFS